MKNRAITFSVPCYIAYLRLLAWLEPILATLYWPTLQAKSFLEDRQANRQAEGKAVCQ